MKKYEQISLLCDIFARQILNGNLSKLILLFLELFQCYL